MVRHQVKPGITGWAWLTVEIQLHGKKNLNLIYGMLKTNLHVWILKLF